MAPPENRTDALSTGKYTSHVIHPLERVLVLCHLYTSISFLSFFSCFCFSLYFFSFQVLICPESLPVRFRGIVWFIFLFFFSSFFPTFVVRGVICWWTVVILLLYVIGRVLTDTCFYWEPAHRCVRKQRKSWFPREVLHSNLSTNNVAILCMVSPPVSLYLRVTLLSLRGATRFMGSLTESCAHRPLFF